MTKHMMDKILAVIAVVLITFTIVMVVTFWKIGAVPDVLITSVFAACLGEFGFMAWIKNIKTKCGTEEKEDGNERTDNDVFNVNHIHDDQFNDGGNEEVVG